MTDKFRTLTDENALLKKEIECWNKWGGYINKWVPVCDEELWIILGDRPPVKFNTTAERDECYDWLRSNGRGR